MCIRDRVKFSRGVPEEIIGADRLGNRTGGRRLLFVGNNIACLLYTSQWENKLSAVSAEISSLWGTLPEERQGQSLDQAEQGLRNSLTEVQALSLIHI